MPFLHSLVDSLYNGVMQFAPEFLRDRPMFSAPVLAASGAYGAVRGLQEVSRRWMDRIIPDFDEEWLPLLEKACLVAVPTVAAAAGFADSEGLQETVSKCPVYTVGMVSAYGGAAVATVRDLISRPERNYMELLDGTRVPLEDIPTD